MASVLQLVSTRTAKRVKVRTAGIRGLKLQSASLAREQQIPEQDQDDPQQPEHGQQIGLSGG